MHTGIISFCDRIGFNIKCPDTKEVILNYLEHHYQVRIIQRHWHPFENSHYPQLQKNPHLASIRSNGNPYYLYFTRYEGVPQMMYIDKKIQPGYQKPRIILSRGRFHESLFENTLIEGEMVKDNRQQWLFLITDILLYKGRTLQDITLPDRLKLLYELLQYYYTKDPIMDVCQFQVKKYVPATQPAVKELLAFAEKLPYSSRGIYLYPLSLKHKPKLINFNDNLVKTVVRKVKDTAGYMELPETAAMEVPPPPPPPPVPQSTLPPPPPPETLELLLRKTDQPDVYDIFSQDKKLGVAAVPTLQTSKMLRAAFKNLNAATGVKFVCRLDSAFNNWVPVKRVQ